MVGQYNLLSQYSVSKIAMALSIVALLSACDGNVTSTKSGSTLSSLSASSVYSVPSGAKAVRVIMRNATLSGQNGSFAISSTVPSGTVPALSSGFKAEKFFDTSNNSISQPSWLSNFEVSVSGSLNTNGTQTSLDSECANFESTATNATFQPALGWFRTSEFNCTNTSSVTTAGTGATTDPVYIRFKIDRSQLAAQENLLVVVDYTASSPQSSQAQSPSGCFGAASTFSPESCSDQTWKVFTYASSTSTTPQPFSLFVPPSLSWGAANVASAANTSQTGTNSRQFVIPLSSDSNTNIIQFSRTSSRLSSAQISTACSGTGVTFPATGGSPFCLGVVYYAVTIYRM